MTCLGQEILDSRLNVNYYGQLQPEQAVITKQLPRPTALEFMWVSSQPAGLDLFLKKLIVFTIGHSFSERHSFVFISRKPIVQIVYFALKKMHF